MNLSYIDLINGFNEWCYDHSLDIKAQIIFFKILYLINKGRWEEWTEISNLRLMDLSKFTSEAAFITHRDKLIELGFFEYKKGKKNQPNRYRVREEFFAKQKEKYTIKYTGKKESTSGSSSDSTSEIIKCTVKKQSTNDSVSDSKTDSISDSITDRHYKNIDKDIDKERTLSNESEYTRARAKESAKNIGKSTNNQASPKSPPTSKEPKRAFGMAKNIFLTDKQHTSLQAKFGDELLKMIEFLSNYIAVHGKKYQDHSRVLAGWVKDAVREQKIKQKELEIRESRLNKYQPRLKENHARKSSYNIEEYEKFSMFDDDDSACRNKRKKQEICTEYPEESDFGIF